jgi:hypothetical protein
MSVRAGAVATWKGRLAWVRHDRSPGLIVLAGDPPYRPD